jgi:hypothetical protein
MDGCQKQLLWGTHDMIHHSSVVQIHLKMLIHLVIDQIQQNADSGKEKQKR